MTSREVALPKLRIGQRGKGKDGWMNLDCHPTADIVSTVPPLPDSVKERRWSIVEGIHVWEHFFKWEAEQLAREIYLMLGHGGHLILECPNLEIACRSLLGQYKDSDSYHMHVFYGDPQFKDPSYGHRWGYTPKTLTEQLIRFGGFERNNVRVERARCHIPERDFRVVATRS